MADNFKASESVLAAFKTLRTSQIGGIDYPVYIPSDAAGNLFPNLPVRMAQSVDANNTTTYTNSVTQYVGTFTRTRSLGIVRQLTVLASDVASGLGGTFV